MGTLEKELTESLAKEMQKTMDFEIIADIMVTMRGYTRVDIEYWQKDNTWIEIKDWVDRNCTGEHTEHLGTWLFEQSVDAVAFKLRWG